MMYEDDNETVSARSSSLGQRSSVENAENNNGNMDSSNEGGTTTNDVIDNQNQTNDDGTSVLEAVDNKSNKEQTNKKTDDEGGETTNSWSESASKVERGPLSRDQEKSDDDNTRKMYNKKEFLWKIHELLEEISNEQKDHIVSWSPQGTSFKVHDPEAFVKEVMPRYSTATQFRSFEKMVRLWIPEASCSFMWIILVTHLVLCFAS
jgi:hypothetical protein